MAQHSFTSLMRRLSAAGFKRDFVRVAVLPDWWDKSCETDPQLLGDVELRVARFLGSSVGIVRNPGAALVVPKYEGAQLRRIKDIDRDHLGPAIHAALGIAAAAARNAKLPRLDAPPMDASAWRAQISRPKSVLRLDDLLEALWTRGIPVLHVDSLPAPSFQGLACVVDGRPVILICHDLDEPGRLAFVIAHEVAHIVFGDCSEGHPVVDEEEEILDDTDIERRADAYATLLLTGGVPIPDVRASGYRDLARKAISIEKECGVDASAVIWAWARRTGDYAKATMAAQALYRTRGGKRVIRSFVDRYLSLDDASDSDRALLRCLYGDPEHDAAAAG